MAVNNFCYHTFMQLFDACHDGSDPYTYGGGFVENYGTGCVEYSLSRTANFDLSAFQDIRVLR
jgi:hypothetical protein